MKFSYFSIVMHLKCISIRLISIPFDTSDCSMQIFENALTNSYNLTLHRMFHYFYMKLDKCVVVAAGGGFFCVRLYKNHCSTECQCNNNFAMNIFLHTQINDYTYTFIRSGSVAELTHQKKNIIGKIILPTSVVVAKGFCIFSCADRI